MPSTAFIDDGCVREAWGGQFHHMPATSAPNYVQSTVPACCSPLEAAQTCPSREIGASEVADKPREVRVRIDVFRLLHIDVKAQYFKAEVLVEASWGDPAMKRFVKDVGDGELTVDECTTCADSGRLFLKGVDDTFFEPRLLFASGYAIENMEQQMELHHFPFDHQELSLELLSRWPRDQVNLVRNANSKYRSLIHKNYFSQKDEYALVDEIFFEQAFTDPETSNSGFQYPMLRMIMHIRRKAGYWGWNIILPLSLITALGMTSFTIETSDTGDRLGVGLTVLLTAVAFKIQIADQLPRTSYLTCMDMYALMCMGSITAIVLSNALVSVLVRAPSVAAEAAEWWDTVLAYACLCVTILINVYPVLKWARINSTVRPVYDVLYVGHIDSTTPQNEVVTCILKALAPHRAKVLEAKFFDPQAESLKSYMAEKNIHAPSHPFVLVRVHKLKRVACSPLKA
eukprot:jgi/Tetstr1/437611/TSEL_026278.t1